VRRIMQTVHRQHHAHDNKTNVSEYKLKR
jgi:hypothetical protein